VALALALAGPVVLAAPGPVAAAAPPKHGLVQVGRTTFWMCKAKTTQILVAVNALVLHPGATLDISFIVRNTATSACNYVAPYAGVVPGPTTTALQAGPCGSIGYEILGPHRRNVWPGPTAYNCPALGFAQLQPGATVNGSGTWPQTKPGSTGRVPAGSYTLVVDGHFSFPIVITAH
jgi:hypothetical protein